MASGSQQQEKSEVFTVREHISYKNPGIYRPPTPPAVYDEESADIYSASWHAAWRAIWQLYNTINHMIIAIVVFSLWRFALSVEANGTVSRFELHIVFAGTGYQLFLVEAILTLSSHNSWSSQLSNDSKRVVHGCLQLIGGIFVLAGTFMIIAEVPEHFTNAHGICGFIALIFSIISLISGLITLFSAKVRLMVKNGPMKLFHVAVATVAVSLGLVTLALGFGMDYFRAGQEGLAVCLITLTSLTAIYVIVHPIKNIYKTIEMML